MACVLTADYTYLGCKGGAGGILTVDMTEIGNVATFAATAGIVTAHTLATGKEYKTYTLDKEMGYFTDTGSWTKASGAISYTQKIAFTMKKLSITLKRELHLVAQNTLLMIVQDINGVFWLFGASDNGTGVGTVTTFSGRGMDMTSWSSESGTAINDFNGFKVEFDGQEIAPIYQVTASLMTTLRAPAV
jgi:hypothetical protein